MKSTTHVGSDKKYGINIMYNKGFNPKNKYEEWVLVIYWGNKSYRQLLKRNKLDKTNKM